MIFYILSRLMPAPFAFIAFILLIVSLPAVILLDSWNRLGRYCSVWAGIPFIAAIWALLIRDYDGEPAEALILFVFTYPICWVAYFAMYRIATRKTSAEICPLILDKVGAEGDPEPEPKFCPKCGQPYFESDYSNTHTVWLCAACKSPIQNTGSIGSASA